MDLKIKPLDVEYDSVGIIDSLTDSERSRWKISEKLMDFLASNGIRQKCANCSTKQGFFDSLEFFGKKASKGKLFCLHFVAHGNREGLGISATGEHIQWGEFRAALTRLNQTMNERLVLNLSSCKGIHGISVVDPVLRETPFFCLVGPKRNILVQDAIRVNEMYYAKQMQGLEIPQAVEEINRVFGAEILYSMSSEFYKKVKNYMDQK